MDQEFIDQIAEKTREAINNLVAQSFRIPDSMFEESISSQASSIKEAWGVHQRKTITDYAESMQQYIDTIAPPLPRNIYAIISRHDADLFVKSLMKIGHAVQRHQDKIIITQESGVFRATYTIYISEHLEKDQVLMFSIEAQALAHWKGIE